VNQHKHRLYLFEQHSESFRIWSATIWINRQTDRHFIRRIRIHSHTKWFTIQCTL